MDISEMHPIIAITWFVSYSDKQHVTHSHLSNYAQSPHFNDAWGTHMPNIVKVHIQTRAWAGTRGW